MTPKLEKTERIVLEPSGNRNKMRREKVHQLKRKKGGDVVLRRLYCCERIHFGLVGAGMRGSSSVCKRGLENRVRQIPVQDVPINERDLCVDHFIYNPCPDPSRGCKSRAETVSLKHATKTRLDVPACAETKSLSYNTPVCRHPLGPGIPSKINKIMARDLTKSSTIQSATIPLQMSKSPLNLL